MWILRSRFFLILFAGWPCGLIAAVSHALLFLALGGGFFVLASVGVATDVFGIGSGFVADYSRFQERYRAAALSRITPALVDHTRHPRLLRAAFALVLLVIGAIWIYVGATQR